MKKGIQIPLYCLKISLFFLFGMFLSRSEAQFKPEISSFELSNGLKVLINRDTTFNEVALYLLADAGFKREQAGQHGMAHLFEHVMLPTRYFYNTETVKNASQHSINSNAQVFNDYVRYYLHFDKNGLDYGLVALADRLDYQVDSLQEDALQRHINNVSSEIARSESYGSFRWRPVFRQALAQGIFGPLHPYGHEQSSTDITRATKKDIQHWYKTWYGASNAMLVILGNVDPATVRQKVETYFGAISPGKQSYHPVVPIPVFKDAREAEITLNQDKRVLYYGWAVPGYGTKENDYFQLLASVLADPSNGVLVRALEKAGIKDAKPFSTLESYQDASVFDLGIEFSDWKDKEKLEALLHDEIQKFMKKPLPAGQLAAASAQHELSFMKGMENIGQNDARIVELSLGAMFLDNPRYFEERLENFKKIKPNQLQQVAAQWLVHPPFEAVIRGQSLQASNQPYNYKQSIPFKTPSAPAALPVFKKKVNEHLTVHAVEQSRIPVVNFTVAFENAMGLPASEMIRYQEPVRQFFEMDPAFQKLQLKGLETEVLVRDKTVAYKVSATKQQAPEVFTWLRSRLTELTTLEKDNSSIEPSSQSAQTLSLLKQLGLPDAAAPNSYPLSHVHFMAVGDLNLQEQPFNWSQLKIEKAKFEKSTSHVPAQIDLAPLLVKDIGESSTSFITLGHFLQPTNIKEDMDQQILLHLLRAKLMSNLREKNSLAYEVYPFTTVPVGNRTLAFWQTSVAVEKTEEAVKQISIELRNITEDADKRITNAKARVMADLKSKYKSLSSIESTIIDNIAYDRPEVYFAKAVAALEEVNTAGFLGFVKKQAQPEHFKLVVFTTPKVAANLTAAGNSVIIGQKATN